MGDGEPEVREQDKAQVTASLWGRQVGFQMESGTRPGTGVGVGCVCLGVGGGGNGEDEEMEGVTTVKTNFPPAFCSGPAPGL